MDLCAGLISQALGIATDKVDKESLSLLKQMVLQIGSGASSIPGKKEGDKVEKGDSPQGKRATPTSMVNSGPAGAPKSPLKKAKKDKSGSRSIPSLSSSNADNRTPLTRTAKRLSWSGLSRAIPSAV